MTPLFPLPNVVLFPGMLLPLHIFEARYLQMVQECLDEDRPFGIQLCRSYDPITLVGEPLDVGTLAVIIDHDFLPDGKINVLVEGTERFRVITYDETSKPYLQGDTITLRDEETALSAPELFTKTFDLFQDAMRLSYKILGKCYESVEIPEDAQTLSFFIAEHLKGSLVLKQELLEMTSVEARLKAEHEVFTRMVKSLAVQAQIEDAFRED